MGQLNIGKATLSVEGIRPLKADVKADDAAMKAQLQNDGYDEIIFKKGDQLYIAYQKNMDLGKLNLNLDAAKFDINAAYDAGQLSMNGDAVQVLYVDDENKSSMWTQPFKTAAQGVTSLLNHPFGKAAMLGFVGGAVTVVAGRNLNIDGSGMQAKAFTGTLLGTGIGSVVGGLKAGAEHDEPEFWDTGAGVGSAALGYGAGALAGLGGDVLVKAAKDNVKIAAITAGVTAAVVGTGIAIDALSDSNKPATMRVINRISAGHEVAPH